MPQQSTNHIMMIEPAEFYANPETMATNVYQVADKGEDHAALLKRALEEFRGFRKALTDAGVKVTSFQGKKGCPDMLFPNWVATFPGGRMLLCPMFNKNRRAERIPEIIGALEKSYPEVTDWRPYEDEGLFLESTGSLCFDHVNKIVYAALSARTSRALVEKWAAMTGLEAVIFDTTSHTGKPVYHTDLVMHIGETLAAVCADCIVDEDRARVLDSLSRTHEVMELSVDQLQAFCGNALAVLGKGGEKILAMSGTAYEALSQDQLKAIARHYTRIIHSPLPTIEKYGGGSARCLMLELF